MSYQESQFLQDDNLEPTTLRHLAMLRLSSTAPSPDSTPTTTTKPHPRFKKCSHCGTLKRRSPCLQQPSPKRQNLLLTSSSTTTTNASVSETGDNPIQLSSSSTPWNFTPPKQPPLFRSLSQPTYSETEKINALSPENSKTPTTSSSPSSAVVGSILRSISDPTVAADHRLMVAATSPPLPHFPRTHTTLSPVSEESPNSRRVKRMKKRIKEMSKWVGEVMKEEEDEDHAYEDLDANNSSKDEIRSQHQEAVWVEKKGDGLVIHFKCPCGEGYEIFLCGNNCYYKLM